MTLKRLLNLSESETHHRLREVCGDFGAKVYAKVRVADVLPIEHSDIDDDEYRYALQAHFDFVVANSEDLPLLVVEFDGRGHAAPDVQALDAIKNALCERFELPLLRINDQYLPPNYSNWDLLRWFCTVYFVSKAWEEDVVAGRIPPDDSVFDPMLVSVRTRSAMRSLELEQEARTELVRLFQSGDTSSHVPNHTLASGSDRTLRAVAWIMTSEADGVIVETAMQHHSVGGWAHFAVRGIALCMLVDRVRGVLSGRGCALSVEELKTKVGDFERQYTTIMALRSGGAA